MQVHELKEWPATFEENDRSHFSELRKGDRSFSAGDLLHIREWVPPAGPYTGRERLAEVMRRHGGAAYGLGAVVLLECVRIKEHRDPDGTQPDGAAR